MTDWTQQPPPRTLGGRLRARGAEEMLAAEMDADHLLAEHLALVETYGKLRQEWLTVAGELVKAKMRQQILRNEVRRLQGLVYDCVELGCEDLCPVVCAGPCVGGKVGTPEDVVPTTTNIAAHDGERHDQLDSDDPVVLNCIWCQS